MGKSSVRFEWHDGKLRCIKAGAGDNREYIIVHEMLRVLGPKERSHLVLPVDWTHDTLIFPAYHGALDLATMGCDENGRPRICDLFDHLTKGCTLATQSAAVGAVVQVADALSVLHSRGIYHGDVKLENVVLDDRNRARLIDFDAVRFERGHLDSDWTDLRRTPEFMSPPRWRDPRQRPTGEDDFYALGAILFGVVTVQTFSALAHSHSRGFRPTPVLKIVVEMLRRGKTCDEIGDRIEQCVVRRGDPVCIMRDRLREIRPDWDEGAWLGSLRALLRVGAPTTRSQQNDPTSPGDTTHRHHALVLLQHLTGDQPRCDDPPL